MDLTVRWTDNHRKIGNSLTSGLIAKVLYRFKVTIWWGKNNMNPGNVKEKDIKLKITKKLVWWRGGRGGLPGVAQWIEHGLQTKGSPVLSPVRAHVWVAGQVPSRGHTRGNHTLMLLSLSFSVLSPLSKNKFKKKSKKKRKKFREKHLYISLLFKNFFNCSLHSV